MPLERYGLIGFAFGFVIGLVNGGGIGIAFGGTAMNGAIPLALAFGCIGLFWGLWQKEVVRRKRAEDDH